MCVYVWVCMYVCMYVYICICMYALKYVCMYAAYVSTYICKNVCRLVWCTVTPVTPYIRQRCHLSCNFSARRSFPVHSGMLYRFIHSEKPGSIPGESTWDFCWEKWHGDILFCEYVGFSRSVIPSIVHIHLSSSRRTAGPLNAAIHPTKKTRARTSSVCYCQSEWGC